MSRRTFHRNALGTLLTVAGAVLIVRTLSAWSNAWPLLATQVLVGAMGGAWIACRSYPELRVGDAAVAGGMGAVLVVGIGHMNHAAAPFPVLVGAAAFAALSAGLTVHVSRSERPTPGALVRLVHAGAVLWAAGMGTVAIVSVLWPRGGDEVVILGAFVSGFVAILVVPGARVRDIALSFFVAAVVPVTAALVMLDGVDRATLAFVLAAIGGLVGAVLAMVGAGLGLLVRHRPALSDVELVPPARIER